MIKEKVCEPLVPFSPPFSEVKGEFTLLRPLRPQDAEFTFQWRQSARASLLNAGAQTVEKQREWISNRPSSERNYLIEMIQPGFSNLPVGMISLIHIDFTHRRAETARFLIGEEERTRGVPVAVEAMKLLYQVAFDELKLCRIYGTVASENRLMIKWQKYLGMKEEGRLRRHYFIQDKFQDAVCLGLLEDEYRRESIPRMNVLIAAGRKKQAQPLSS